MTLCFYFVSRPPGAFASTTGTGRHFANVLPAAAPQDWKKRSGQSVAKSIAFAELRATRKPRLLLRFDGSLLLRFADRQLSGLFLQLPPRFTRLEPLDRSPLVTLAHGSETASSPLHRPSQKLRSLILAAAISAHRSARASAPAPSEQDLDQNAVGCGETALCVAATHGSLENQCRELCDWYMAGA